MILSMMMALLMAQEPAPPAANREPRHRQGLPFISGPPQVSPPYGGDGFVQVALFCTASGPDRLGECRILRQMPEDSVYGRRMLQRLRGFRLERGSTIAGDTFEFQMWVCRNVQGPCLPRPWPDSVADDPDPTSDGPPRWARLPELQYPRSALSDGRPGWARVDCLITVDGSAEDCRIVEESPAELGFGAAALAAHETYGFHPAREAGAPVAARVTFRVSFQKE